MTNHATHTQLAVLGAGPGGYTAAFYAADLGMTVTLIDKEAAPGGVCLHRGCIPSKALLHTTRVMDEAEQAARFGLTFAKPDINLDKMRSHKEGIIKQLGRGLLQLTKARKINFIQGTAGFVDPRTLHVQGADGRTHSITADHTIIATGSRPAGIPGVSLVSERLWNSKKALELQNIPKRLLVVGGGYIGLELGSVYASLGTEVLVVEMTDGILPGVDRDLALVLQKKLKAKFKGFLFNTKVLSIREATDGLCVGFEDTSKTTTEEFFDHVFISTGRQPTVDGLHLDCAGVACTERGFIRVDGARRTSQHHIFAIGDIAGNPMLAHKASFEARIAVENILGKERLYQPKAIPAVVFTDPEIAWCGVSEESAKQQGISYEVAKFPWTASGRAMTLGAEQGLTKLVIEPQSGKILGVGIVGCGAGDLISEGVVAVEMGATVQALARCIHPHPTLSETILEAAELHLGHCTHLYKPKKHF
ncbi:MAG: dihydrolipoyl dehydrogenase [Deltaproteobacteria bacterium]|nr:dihydrolipoyl dehydrogenase [Deltaproteobacteria bacterium]